MKGHTIRLRDGRNLGYCVYGKSGGVPLLFFHGTPGSRLFNRFENASWIEKFGIRIITPERPGYGLSDPAPARKIEGWAKDVESLVDFLGVNRFHVAGGSGGGPFALACAIQMPARVLSTTLVSSGGPPEAMRSSKDMQAGNRVIFFLAQYAPFLLKRLLASTAKGLSKRPEKFMERTLAKFPECDRRIVANQNREDLLSHLSEAFRQGVDGTYFDTLLVARPWGLDLDRISVPVFMWHGTADTLAPVSAARALSKLIPGCETHFIAGAGHQLLGREDIRSQMIARMLSVRP